MGYHVTKLPIICFHHDLLLLEDHWNTSISFIIIAFLSDELNFSHICTILQKGPMMPSTSSTLINAKNWWPCIIIDANQVGMKFLKVLLIPCHELLDLLVYLPLLELMLQ